MKKLIDYWKEFQEKRKQDKIREEADKLEQLNRQVESLRLKKRLLVDLAKAHEDIAREELEIKDLERKIKMSNGLVKTMNMFGDVLKKTDAVLSENIKVDSVVVKTEPKPEAKPEPLVVDPVKLSGLKVEDVSLKVKTKKINKKVI